MLCGSSLFSGCSKTRTLDPPHQFQDPRLPNKATPSHGIFPIKFFLFFLFFYEKRSHRICQQTKFQKKRLKKEIRNSNYPPKTKQNRTEVWLFLPSRLSAQSLRGPHWGLAGTGGLVKCFGPSWGLGSGPLHLSPSLVHLGAHTVHMGRVRVQGSWGRHEAGARHSQSNRK